MSYGIAIKLNNDFDYYFNEETNNIELVSDENNIKQVIDVILTTIKGELLFYPDFGTDIKYIMTANIPHQYIKQVVEEELLKDPRIAAVESIELHEEYKTLKINIKIKTYRGAIVDSGSEIRWLSMV